MKATCVANATFRLLLIPENPLEELFLQTMARESEKGATTILAAPLPDGKEYVLEVGGKP